MVEDSTLHARIVSTHDVEANWNKTSNFIPRAGEIIVYDPDSSHTHSRFKIGDGLTDVKNLNFVHETMLSTFISNIFGVTSNNVIYLDGGCISEYNIVTEES